jgi:hypothetical protein
MTSRRAPGTGPSERAAKFFALAAHVVRPLLESPAHRLLSKQLMVLTYTGPRTGRRFSFPIGYFGWDDGEVLSFTSRSWHAGLARATDVRLRIKGKVVSATPIVVQAQDDKVQLLRAFAHRHGPRAAKRLQLGLPGERQPSDDELVAAAASTTIVRFRTQPPVTASSHSAP